MDLHHSAIDAAKHSIAIVFDFVDPAIVRRSIFTYGGELRADKSRQRRLARPCYFRQIDTNFGSDFRFPYNAVREVFRNRFVRMPNPTGIGGNLFKAALSGDTVGQVIDHPRLRPRAGILIILFEQQPGLVAAVLAAVTLYQSPTAVKFFTVEIELEFALFVTGNRIFFRQPRTAIPKQYGSRRRIVSPE